MKNIMIKIVVMNYNLCLKLLLLKLLRCIHFIIKIYVLNLNIRFSDFL